LITASVDFLRTDSDAELEAIRVAALEAGADAAVPSFHWGEGGKGALALANAVVDTCNADKQSFRYLYDLDTSIEEKVGIIAREIYGADGIELSEEASKKVALYDKQVPASRFEAMLISRGSDICLFALQRLSILSPQMRMPREYLLDLKSPFEIFGYLEGRVSL
jgi:formyltetrahydrofolate synthetase